ncbi:1-(5-phosphoribosyl)-5-[(5-phosphoribosylamino)methylideneamino] imidazole-4-carboxamide isomerase [Koleobacter methoxysyntrophicus]|uniref:1-(5-phosphoribosyl)-5-[(5-phosphoribosylamino)methylideneamino] imidazole-4-carboxamide isomerase n=1 Tax=Koleobacter methoxysyntrophicus TaxID=2751313 RepID=A0A8A0RMI4_9FIRM|nr:1-(5-phosphoribosyl)-5-[(5-phosphoribosylamino)methylideneamino]imidazole-4-carboxamide isomerase [Koleobacter methoxysyntrophicus]QSQ09621.1 1-(5-phosphoribosyl)-5-[(5-phosphoribosylamino)methylideneamino] imidazole-4-carboxamide isomerase [Koleobacter methoxysyntrophicus]
MLIIPAVDIRGGRCVRLTQGRFDREQVFSNDPVEMALNWQEKGAKRLHVVDLDGAVQGKPQNLKVIEKIVNTVNIPVQLGGGIRDIDTIDKCISIGIDRVIMGTSAVFNREIVKKAVSLYPDKVIVGIDAKDGRVAVKGWLEISEQKSVDLIKEIEQFGINRIIYTDITKDGMMTGPNLAALEEILENTGMKVIASGGISSIGDLIALKKMEVKGLEGAIIGKALYLGKIDLKAALEIMEGEDS